MYSDLDHDCAPAGTSKHGRAVFTILSSEMCSYWGCLWWLCFFIFVFKNEGCFFSYVLAMDPRHGMMCVCVCVCVCVCACVCVHVCVCMQKCN